MEIFTNRKNRFLFLMVLLFLVISNLVFAGADTKWTGGTSNDWDEPSNWTGGVPTSTDKVEIKGVFTNSPTIYPGTDAEAKELKIKNGTTLNMDGGTLSIYENWKNEGGTTTFNGTGGDVIFAGDGGDNVFTQGTNNFFNIIVNSGIDPGFDEDANTTINIGGNYLNNGDGDFDGTTTTVNFNGSGNQVIGGTSSTSFRDININNTGGIVSLGANQSVVGGNLTIIDGTLDLGSYTLNRTASGGTMSIASGAELILGGSSGGQTGSNFPTGYSSVTISSGSTVEYDMAGAQTVYTTPTYSNLTLSGSGAKTIGTATGNTLSTGTLSIAPTGTATASVTNDNVLVNIMTFGGTQQSIGTWGYSTGSPDPVYASTTYFANNTGYLNNCITLSLTSTSASSPAFSGSFSTVTLTNTTPANLPAGSYTVTYNLSGTNVATGLTTSMTVSAGTGDFNTSTLANTGSTTVTVTNLLTGGCTNSISANNSDGITVEACNAGSTQPLFNN